jgi:hypothetical protein
MSDPQYERGQVVRGHWHTAPSEKVMLLEPGWTGDVEVWRCCGKDGVVFGVRENAIEPLPQDSPEVIEFLQQYALRRLEE